MSNSTRRGSTFCLVAAMTKESTIQAIAFTACCVRESEILIAAFSDKEPLFRVFIFIVMLRRLTNCFLGPPTLLTFCAYPDSFEHVNTPLFVATPDSTILSGVQATFTSSCRYP